MLRITIELLSAHGPQHNKVLGTAYIINDGTGTHTHGNYRFLIGRKGQSAKQAFEDPRWGGFVKGFPRKRLLSWDLLFRALQQPFGARNRSER